jgi:hypothetical protein
VLGTAALVPEFYAELRPRVQDSDEAKQIQVCSNPHERGPGCHSPRPGRKVWRADLSNRRERPPTSRPLERLRPGPYRQMTDAATDV